MAKDDDLDSQVLLLTLRKTHQLEHADEGKVEEGERDASSSSRRSRQRKSRPQVRMTFSAPTGTAATADGVTRRAWIARDRTDRGEAQTGIVRSDEYPSER